MKFIPRLLLFIGQIAAALLISGCSTGKNTLPRDLPSMRTIYESHQSGEGADESIDARLREARTTTARPLRQDAVGLQGYTRTAWNEIEHLFAPLPNPMIVLYIDPHLSEAGHPVPGYATAFTLYESLYHALPGEVPPPSQPVGVWNPAE